MATSTGDNVRDDKGGEGSGDASPASGADPYGFHAETPSPRSLGETVERSTRNSPRRAKLKDGSATELADQAFPVSQSFPHLSPPPLLPAAQRETPAGRLGRLFRLGNLTSMGKNRQKQNEKVPA